MAPKTIDDIIRRVRQNIKSESSIQLIIDAYEVAKAQHGGNFANLMTHIYNIH